MSQFGLFGKAPIRQLGHLVVGKVHVFQLSIELEGCIHRPVEMIFLVNLGQKVDFFKFGALFGNHYCFELQSS